MKDLGHHLKHAQKKVYRAVRKQAMMEETKISRRKYKKKVPLQEIYREELEDLDEHGLNSKSVPIIRKKGKGYYWGLDHRFVKQ